MHSRLPSSVLRKQCPPNSHVEKYLFSIALKLKILTTFSTNILGQGITFYENSFSTYHKTLKVDGLGRSYILYIVKCYLFPLRFYPSYSYGFIYTLN